MVFYLAGLGLNLKSISLEALEICRKADKIYLEGYTVDFPYNVQKIEGVIGKRVIPMTRIMVENEKFLEEAKSKDIVLLVYGNPLIATTHISLVLKCKKESIDYRVLQNSSIFDAVGETGLQNYKFGKTASLPKWQESFKPDSFIEIIKSNQNIKAHTLLLVDIGLDFGTALNQIEESCKKKKFKINRMIVCSKLGTEESSIHYEKLESLYGKEIYPPFCFIIPSEMHFVEKEALNELKEHVK
ncbi:diphthine synthase [Candidatus Pacearchaeota archaeon]|nr:diphthine synthase [Candidatus Pacearchaeota archaeon]